MNLSAPRFAAFLRTALVGTVLAGLVVGCGAEPSAIVSHSTDVPISAPESIQVMRNTVGDWVATETEWMKALIDNRIGLDEFEELFWRAEESGQLILTAIRENLELLPAEAQDALRPVLRHLAERADAFGTMSLLYFEGSEDGWQASVRNYLVIIDPAQVSAVTGEVRAAVDVADIDADTSVAIEALLVTLEQSDSDR